MSAQENQDPYHGEDPNAIAKELGISLKALESLVSIVDFNTPLDIPLSLRVGLETLGEEAVAQTVHEDLVREAVTQRLRQEIDFINQQPVPERLPQEIEYNINEPEQEPSLFDPGVGQRGATDGPPNLTAPPGEGVPAPLGSPGPRNTTNFGPQGGRVNVQEEVEQSGRVVEVELGMAPGAPGPPGTTDVGTSGAVGDASPQAP